MTFAVVAVVVLTLMALVAVRRSSKPGTKRKRAARDKRKDPAGPPDWWGP